MLLTYYHCEKQSPNKKYEYVQDPALAAKKAPIKTEEK